MPHRPLGFFTLLVETQPYAMVFSRSLFVSLLDRAERLIPSLTPESMKDDRPLMRPPVSLQKGTDHLAEKQDAPAGVVPANEGSPGGVLWLLVGVAFISSMRSLIPHG